MPLVQATRWRLHVVATLRVAVVCQLMNEISDTTVLHLDLLDLLVLIRVVAVRAALVELAFCFPVVAFHRAGRLWAVAALVQRLFLLQLEQHTLLKVQLQALLFE